MKINWGLLLPSQIAAIHAALVSTKYDGDDENEIHVTAIIMHCRDMYMDLMGEDLLT